MAEGLGSIRGQIDLDVRGAMAGYTALRQEHLSTLSALGQASGTLAQVGGAFLGLGTTIAGAFVGAGLAYGEFEAKMDYMGAVSDASAKDMAKLSDMVLRLGADTVYTNDEIALGFTELAKAGVSAEAILGGIGEGITHLGAAADIGLDKAATMMMSVVATWGMAETEATRVADVLAGTANSSMVEIEDLGVSMKYAGGVAASMGISFDDVSTALGIMGQRSIKGSTAGTSLRQIMIGLTGNTKKATKEMEALGIITEDGANKFFTAEGKAKSLKDVMNILRDATDGMSAAQQTQSLKTMFNIRALPSLIALLDAGSAGFDEMAASIQGVSAADVAAARLDNLSGDMEYLKGEIDNLILSFGSLTQGALRTIVQALEDVIHWFNSLSDEGKSIVINVALVSAAVLILGGAFLLAAAMGTQMVYQLIVIRQALIQLGGVATVVSRIMAFMFKPPVIIMIIIAALAALTGALMFFFQHTEQGRAAWEQITAAFSAFMAGPGAQLIASLTQLAGIVGGWLAEAFTAVAGALGGVGQGFGTAAGGVGSLLSSGLGAVAQLFSTLGGILMSVIQPVITALAPIFQQFGEAIAGVSTNMTGMSGFADIFAQILVAVIEMATQLVVVFIELGVQLLTAIIGMLPTLVEGFVTLLTTIINTVVGMLPQLVTAFTTGLTALIDGIVPLIPVIIEAVIQLIMAIITAVVGMIPQLIQAAIQLFQGLLDGLMTALPLIIEGLTTAIPMIITAIVGAIPLLIQAGIQLFMALIDALIIIIPQVITALTEAIPQVMTALIEAIPVILDAAIQAFTAIVEALPKIIPPLIEAIISLLPVLIESLIGMIPQLIQGALQLFLAIVQAIPQIISSLIPALIGLLPTIINTVISLIPMLIEAAVQLFMAIVQAIPQIIGAIVDALWKMGEDMIQGLIDGLKDMGPKVLEAIGGIVDGAIGWAKDLLGIKSPSRVFRSIGDYLGKGFIQGINKNKSGVEKATKGLVDVTKKSFTNMRQELEKENKRLADLWARHAHGERSWQLDKAIAEQDAKVVALKKAVAKEKSVLDKINTANKKLMALTSQRDAIVKKLDDAKKKLQDALDDKNAYKAEYRASVNERGNVSDLKTTDGMIYNLENQVKKAQEFKKLYDDLKKRGADATTLRELADKFQADGSLSAAQALAGGTDAELKRIAELRKSLDAEANRVASQLGNDFHDAGIRAAQGIVNGLNSQLTKINNTAKSIADALTKAVKKQLGIKSPSRVFAELGGYTMEGLVKGLAGGENEAKRQLQSMADAMTDFYDQVFAAKQFELETALTMKATENAAINAPQSNGSAMQSSLEKILLKLESLTSNQTTPEVNQFGDIVIPLKDLESIRNLEDFIEKIKMFKAQGSKI